MNSGKVYHKTAGMNRRKLQDEDLPLGTFPSSDEKILSLKYNLSKYESSKNYFHRRAFERFYETQENNPFLFYLANDRSNFGYVGLVNQAMTCYLNSLLQALFMTPEFRNALYDWEFDGEGESKSIPYQLQKLFLNLQVSFFHLCV